MALSPLISLQAQGPDIEDPLVQRGKATALINAQQQQQINGERLRSEQLANQETVLKQKDDQLNSQSWQQAGGDPTKHVDMFGKSGARPQAVQALQKHYADLDKEYAEIGDKKLQVQKYQNEQFTGLVQQARALPDDQYAALYPQIKASALKIHPELQLPDQAPPKDALAHIELGLVTEKSLIDRAEEQRKQTAEQRAAALAPSQQAKATADATIAQQTATGQKPIQPEEQARLDLSKRSEERIANHDAATERNATALLKVAQGRLGLEGQHAEIAKNIYEQTYGAGANPALQGVEPKLRTQAASAAQKAADEFTKASESLRGVQTFIDLARSGNKAAGSNLPIMGAESIQALNGIKRINRSEIEQYQGAGSLFDKIQGRIGKLVSGQPIDKALMDDIEKLHKAIGENSAKSYNDRLASINQNYHANYQPVKGAAAPGGTIRARDPQGNLHEAPAGTPLPAGWTEEKKQ